MFMKESWPLAMNLVRDDSDIDFSQTRFQFLKYILDITIVCLKVMLELMNSAYYFHYADSFF
jgi:hypothetical protein